MCRVLRTVTVRTSGRVAARVIASNTARSSAFSYMTRSQNLSAHRHTVEPIEDGFGLWLVEGGKPPFSDAELIAYAYTLGLVEQPTPRSSIMGRPSLDTS